MLIRLSKDGIEIDCEGLKWNSRKSINQVIGIFYQNDNNYYGNWLDLSFDGIDLMFNAKLFSSKRLGPKSYLQVYVSTLEDLKEVFSHLTPYISDEIELNSPINPPFKQIQEEVYEKINRCYSDMEKLCENASNNMTLEDLMGLNTKSYMKELDCYNSYLNSTSWGLEYTNMLNEKNWTKSSR